jgi:hypothetical protein
MGSKLGGYLRRVGILLLIQCLIMIGEAAGHHEAACGDGSFSSWLYSIALAAILGVIGVIPVGIMFFFRLILRDHLSPLESAEEFAFAASFALAFVPVRTSTKMVAAVAAFALIAGLLVGVHEFMHTAHISRCVM